MQMDERGASVMLSVLIAHKNRRCFSQDRAVCLDMGEMKDEGGSTVFVPDALNINEI